MPKPMPNAEAAAEAKAKATQPATEAKATQPAPKRRLRKKSKIVLGAMSLLKTRRMDDGPPDEKEGI